MGTGCSSPWLKKVSALASYLHGRRGEKSALIPDLGEYATSLYMVQVLPFPLAITES